MAEAAEAAKDAARASEQARIAENQWQTEHAKALALASIAQSLAVIAAGVEADL